MPGPEIQFLTVNHDKYVPFSDGSGKTGARGGKHSMNSSSHPRSRVHQPFDLCSLLDQLPPNTGPPGTVPTNNGTGLGANANKNLSHVPCKFFRQGNCQAGNSCPFSHNFDGSSAVDKLPCKYFQKGNCKFGSKCALAHFLPDGTRVNLKSLRRQERTHGVLGGNHYGGGNVDGSSTKGETPLRTSSKNSGYNSVQDAAFSANYIARTSQMQTSLGSSYRSHLPQPGERISFTQMLSAPDVTQHAMNDLYGEFGDFHQEHTRLHRASFDEIETPVSLASRRSMLHSSGQAFHLTYASRNKPNSPPGTYQSTHTWLTSATTPVNTSLSASIHNNIYTAFKSMPSTSPTNLKSLPNSIDLSANLFSASGSQSQLPQDHFVSSTNLGMMHNHQRSFFPLTTESSLRLLDESAILDGSNEDDFDDDENAFFEDYVPASLGNLILTPQEQQRRDSRSQSGTLWVRPNIERSPSDNRKHCGGENAMFMMD